MNLIEQLGGYAQAKNYAVDANACGAFDDEKKIKSALLDYRRQHNIFEEFDMLVYMEMSDISKIYRMVSVKPNSEGYIWMMGKGGLVYENIKYLTHANDEEIQAGRRL